MKLTKKEKQLMIDVWTWLHDNPLKEKHDCKFKQIHSYINDCVYCHYYLCRWNCSYCPLYQENHYCLNKESYYYKWANAKTDKQSQKYSWKILEIIKKY